jgi:hypothetical protein
MVIHGWYKMTEEIGELGEVPNAKWQKFFDQFSEIETLEVSKWKIVHLLAYFSMKYKHFYGVDFKFKFNATTPAKSFEVFQMKRLGLLMSSDPTILKNYIDWAFKEKASGGKRRFTSISFITDEQLVNYYKMNYLLCESPRSIIDRSTPLPQEYIDVIRFEYDTDINTYGDLAFLHMRYSTSYADIDVKSWNDTLQALQRFGFDPSILDKIK